MDADLQLQRGSHPFKDPSLVAKIFTKLALQGISSYITSPQDNDSHPLLFFDTLCYLWWQWWLYWGFSSTLWWFKKTIVSGHSSSFLFPLVHPKEASRSVTHTKNLRRQLHPHLSWKQTGRSACHNHPQGFTTLRTQPLEASAQTQGQSACREVHQVQ